MLTRLRSIIYTYQDLTTIPIRETVHTLMLSSITQPARLSRGAGLLTMQDEQLRKAFGARLKTLRKQKNWSQKELAAKVEIRFQQLNKYESGLNTPPAEMLVKLADSLSVSVDFLLTGGSTESAAMGNSRLFRRFQVLDGFPADDQETVIKVIDALVAKQRMATALAPVDAAA